MPSDPKIDEVKTTLDAINAADIAEDSAYEARIAELESERAGIIAELIAARDSLSARITALGG